MSTKRERRERQLAEQRERIQQQDRDTRFAEIEKRQQRTKRMVKAGVYGSLAIIIIAIVAFTVSSRIAAAQPGKYDGFAKCLTEKGAIMYGAIEWCEYTQTQARMFGNSFKYIDYRNYRELPGIRKTPTWVINGEMYERVQSFERLSSLTGCKIDGE